MSRSIDAIAAVSRAVALEHGRGLEVVGVTSTDGGSDRAEILITVNGCHEGDCRLLININRLTGPLFEVELRKKLIEALRVHDAR